MSQTSSEDSETIRGEFTLVPVISTPKINRGGKIVIDYYVTGRHPEDSPPECVRLNVNLGGISIESAQVSQNIAQQWEEDGGSVCLKKEKGMEIFELPEKGRVFFSQATGDHVFADSRYRW